MRGCRADDLGNNSVTAGSRSRRRGQRSGAVKTEQVSCRESGGGLQPSPAMKTWGSMRPSSSYQTLPTKTRPPMLLGGLSRHREGEVVAVVSPMGKATNNQMMLPTSVQAATHLLSRPPRPAVSRSISFSTAPRPETALFLARQRKEDVGERRIGRSQSVYGLQHPASSQSLPLQLQPVAAPTLPFGSCASCGSTGWRPLEEEELPQPEASPLSKLGYNSIKSRSLLSLNQTSLSAPKPLQWTPASSRYSSTGTLAVSSTSTPTTTANILSKSHRSSSARNLLFLNELNQECKSPADHAIASLRVRHCEASITLNTAHITAVNSLDSLLKLLFFS